MKIPEEFQECVRRLEARKDPEETMEYLRRKYRDAHNTGQGEMCGRLATAIGRVREGQWEKALDGLTA